MMLVAANIAFISSCKKDDDGDDPTKPSPTIAVGELSNSGTEITVAPGTSLTFAWNAIKAGGGKDMLTFEVSTAGVNSTSDIPTSFQGNDFPLQLKNADDEQYQDTVKFDGATQNLNVGITTYTFKVTDKDGQIGTASIQVTVEEPVTTTPLATEELDGKFYHVEGSLRGAYDLVAATLKGSMDDDADKDFKNTDAAGDPFTGSSTAGNGTMFVKTAATYDATGTVEAALAAYTGGTASGTITDPSAGDVYVAKLRGGDDYAVIEVLTVDPDDNTCGCGNTGIMTFKFKKK